MHVALEPASLTAAGRRPAVREQLLRRPEPASLTAGSGVDAAVRRRPARWNSVPRRSEGRRRPVVAPTHQRGVERPDRRPGCAQPLLGDQLVRHAVPPVGGVPVDVGVVLAAVLLVLAALVLDRQPVVGEPQVGRDSDARRELDLVVDLGDGQPARTRRTPAAPPRASSGTGRRGTAGRTSSPARRGATSPRVRISSSSVEVEQTRRSSSHPTLIASISPRLGAVGDERRLAADAAVVAAAAS